MSKKYKDGLFIFHRDLRIEDNTTLLEALKICHKVYCCFIFTKEQASSENRFRSLNALSFMIESLESLSTNIKKSGGELAFFYGSSEIQVLQKLVKEIPVDCVFFNSDYTPYAVERESVIKELCDDLNIHLVSRHDLYLQEPGSIVSQGSQEAYKKFTPFYEAVLKKPVLPPSRSGAFGSLSTFPKNSHQKSIDSIKTEILPKTIHGSRIVIGGRKEGLRILNRALQTQSEYAKTRDYMSKPCSQLSAYIKFGVLSIREVYDAFKKKYGSTCEFIRQLYWRDFYAHLLFAFPKGLTGEHFSGIRWSSSKTWFQAWSSGKTGFPIVDAAIRELIETGYMHNRGRMIVASFLTKTLGLSWKLGEHFFATHLTDYDVASNNGNWQNISSTGIYAEPYFRDMNPWIQSKKFDPDCEYIKKWVPELAEIPIEVIHKWYDLYKDSEYKDKYCKPICVYEEQKKVVLEKYEKALS
jgi:deoxyribodipyrimidine photo-lyase